MAPTSRLSSLLAAVVAAYLAVLLARYFYPPHIPRFRVETIFMWFLTVGLIACALRPGTSSDAARGTDRDWAAPAGRGPASGTTSYHEQPFAIWHAAVLGAAFTVVAFLLYGGALQIGFLSDDFVLADWAAKRQWVHAAETGFVRPVVPMFWAALAFVPLPFEVTLHVANILLHAVNAVLVVALAAGFGLRRDEAVAAGLLFLTFSALTEAVVWVSGMQDVLMTTLTLGAISATVAIGVRPLAGFVAVACGAIALGVKETAVVIPLLAGLVLWASPGGVRHRAQRTTLVAMTTLAIVYVIFRLVSGVSSNYGQGVSRYFAKQLLVEPFATLGEPWSAAWMQAHPTIALVRAALILALVAVAFSSWRRGDAAFRRAVVSAAWVLIAVLPVFSLFHVSPTLEGSRYLYLPAAGFALLVATLIGDLAGRTARSFRSGLVAVLVLVLAVPSMTARRGELERWIEAARLRDAILGASSDELPKARCHSVVADGVVDNVDGAYVLRNGFMQAMAARGLSTTLDGQASVRCRVSWTDRLVIGQEP